MSTDETRKRLLGEFAVALVAEHAAWNQLRDPQLGEAERVDCVAKWKTAKARLKLLAQQVRADEAHAGELGAPLAPGQSEASPALRRGLAWGKHLVTVMIAFASYCRDVVRSAAARFAA